ncbi:hypothetical protein GYH30_047976 [Glycine max]|nr:hypothetical protein GYH30_047976 [Glycine max]
MGETKNEAYNEDLLDQVNGAMLGFTVWDSETFY